MLHGIIVYAIHNYEEMKMVWTLLAVSIVALVSFPLGVLLHRRLRQQRIAANLQIRGAHGIVEDGFREIGGIEQWIGIRGEDERNPVLLLIHGGPGSSCSIFTPVIRSWENAFTVVQWDQRGSGKTLGKTGQSGTGELTMDRLVQDGIEVAEFVRTRLRKDKIVLMACSLGSTFGLTMIRRRPDLFSAYVGTDQNVGMARDREKNHKALVDRLRANGLKKGVAALEKLGSDPSRWTAKEFTATAKWTMKSDPRFYERTMQLLKTSIWFCPDYKLRDIGHFVSGMHFSLDQLISEVRIYDAWQDGIQFEVPFFVFQGADDVLTPPELARAYCDDVLAPVKGMTLIQDAGHFAAFTQPEQFLNELMTRVRPLAMEPQVLAG
jgi:pimeloyl-ACP methyl ester carboxylesterase